MIDRLMETLTEAFGPLGPVYALAAGAALLIAIAAPALLKRRIDPIEKLGRPRHSIASAQEAAAGAGAPRLRYDSGSGKLDALAPFLEPKNEKELSSIRQTLLEAGYRSRSAVRTFYFIRGVGAILLVSIAVIALSAREEPPSLSVFLIVSSLALAVGYLAPNYWVTRRKQARQQEISNGFPDALDLMLICVEAGQSLDQSLQRVSREVRHAHPSLADELEIVSVEMRAGKDRPVVLRDFAKRTGVTDVKSFVTVLIQSANFGTSVADALQVYAAEMRDKRLMRAEAKANVLPTKLTLGTMMFTVPPLMLILIGPSLVDIIKALSSFR